MGCENCRKLKGIVEKYKQENDKLKIRIKNSQDEIHKALLSVIDSSLNSIKNGGTTKQSNHTIEYLNIKKENLELKIKYNTLEKDLLNKTKDSSLRILTLENARLKNKELELMGQNLKLKQEKKQLSAQCSAYQNTSDILTKQIKNLKTYQFPYTNLPPINQKRGCMKINSKN